ncbi:L-lactate dehydrogenase [Aureobasidium subglaciale]|nr:L-lactate dehydrogenase [Aureobasidium subglaciale]
MSERLPHDLNCLTISELQKHAAVMMDKQTRDYYNEGSDSGSTLQENLDAYAKYRIRPRVLRDVSNIDTSVNIFGHRNTVPLGVAPTAMQRLAHSDGELATARACKKMGIAMGLSSFATTTLEDVAEANGENPHVLQLYLFEERDHSVKLLKRAKEAGYKAVFLTVDTPILGRRNLEIRNQFKLPAHLTIPNFAEQGDKQPEAETEQRGQAKTRRGSEAGYTDNEGKRVFPTGPITFHSHAANPTLSWERDIEWLKKECGKEMQVWVKGIATAEDALLAVHHGVDGIVVSNHGGRQLNGALATLDALPEVVAAVQGKIPVHVDGGIRHGTDVFKALALGADFVWIGRPVLWGLAYKGQEGVELCLRLLSDEIRLAMGLAGVTKVDEISKEYLVKIDKSGFVARLPVLFSENARPSTIPPHIRHLAWSSTGAALATTAGSKVRIWNPDRPNVKSSQELVGHVGSVEKIVWNPVREGEVATTGSDGTVKLWDVRVGPGAHNKAVPVKEIALGDGGLFLAWSPTGQHLVAGRRDDVIVPIDVRMGAMANTEDLIMQEGRKLGSAQTNQMAFSNSGREVFATTGDGTVKVLDWPSMTLLHTLNAHTSAAYSVQHSPNGDFVAVGGGDSLVTLWDTTDWVCKHTISNMAGGIHCLSFSFDGTYICGAHGMDKDGDKGIHVACAQTGETVHTFETANIINVLAWHPLRYWLAYAGDTGGVRVIGLGGNL